MFIADYSQQPRHRNNINVPQEMNKSRKCDIYTYTVEYYLVFKKILLFDITWVNLEGIMLSDISHTEKDKYCVVSLIRRIVERKKLNSEIE